MRAPSQRGIAAIALSSILAAMVSSGFADDTAAGPSSPAAPPPADNDAVDSNANSNNANNNNATHNAKPTAAPRGLRLIRTLGDGRLRHATTITQITPLPDGERVVTTTRAAGAHLWHLKTGKELQRFDHEDGSDVWNAQLLPGGKELLTCADNYVYRWSLETGEQLAKYNLRGTTLRLAVLPGGKRFVAATRSNRAELWDIENAAMVHAYKGHTSSVYGVSVAPDGKRVVTCSEDKSIRIWDTESGELLHKIEDHTKDVHTVAYSPDGARFVTCGEDGAVRMAKAETGESIWKKTLPEDLKIIAFAPDGQRVAASCEDGHVYVLDAATGEQKLDLDVDVGTVWAVAFSHDGNEILSGGDQVLHRWDAKSGERLFPAPDAMRGAIEALAATGERVLVAGAAGRVHWWNGKTGEALTQVKIEVAAQHMAVSPDGQALLALDTPGDLHVFNADDGQRRFKRSFEPDLNDAAFALGGKRIVAVDDQQNFHFLNAEDGQTLLRHNAPQNSYYSGTVAVSPDGALVAGAMEGAVRIYGAEKGDVISTLTAVGVNFTHCAFTPHGLLAGDRDDKLYVWTVPVRRSEQPPGQKQLSKWVKQLGSEDFRIREAATKGLIAAGEKGVAALKTANLKDPEVKYRVKVIERGVSRLNVPTRSAGEPIKLGKTISALAADPAGRCWVAATGYDATGQLVLGQLTETGASIIATVPDHHSPQALHFSTDGKTLYTGNRDGTVSVYAVE